ncbi:MAG: hypothetical protein JNJ77_08325 [Planctomycetia bacterium]|nr:hypothetical protein [Planctomycetia bacterium]
MNQKYLKEQIQVCTRFGVTPMPCPSNLKLGISENVREGVLPINGVHLREEGDTCGWYIWAGEESNDPTFFSPLHVEHLENWCPGAIPYLMLPVGWRFQIAPGHEDVWFDAGVVELCKAYDASCFDSHESS